MGSDVPIGDSTATDVDTKDQIVMEDLTVYKEVGDKNVDKKYDIRSTIDSDALVVANSLDGRLLCASECAYDIDNPYYKGAGFLAGSQIQRLSVGVNSCLVGRTIDGIVVAFRGTQGGSPLDWLQNAALFLRKVPPPFAPSGSRVHEGFYNALARSPLGKSVKKSVRGCLQDIKDSGGNTTERIYVTGHSKGGSLASLFALMMHKDPNMPDPSAVYTFGAAKIGNEDFCNHFNSIVNQTTYENDLDIIPFLPPGQNTMDDMMEYLEDPNAMMNVMDQIFWSENDIRLLRNKSWGRDGKKNRPYFWKYDFVGRRIYLDSTKTLITNVTRRLDIRRIQDIERKTLWNIKEFAKAHCSACFNAETNCGGGYFEALAPEVCQYCFADFDNTTNDDILSVEETDVTEDQWQADTLQKIFF